MNEPPDLVDHAFDLAFRDFYLTDILRANECDVRMGTFVLYAAFLDALSLTYSAGIKVPGKNAAKWTRFFHRYFPPSYKPIAGAYGAFRSLLLHNYSAAGLAFTHGPENEPLHLTVQQDFTVLHRESFVRDVQTAFEAFRLEVRTDLPLRARVEKHFATRPPMGLAPIVRQVVSSVGSATAASGAGPPVERT